MREHPATEDLSGVVLAALGTGHRIRGVDRLRGGTKKGVHRVRLDGGAVRSVIVYRWAREENFWHGTGEDDPADLFAPASGLAPFLAAQRRLAGLGIRVPRVLWADGDRRHAPADAAVVEDVPGGTLEEALETDPARAATALEDLGRALDLMRGERSPRCGRVDLLERENRAPGGSCGEQVLARALRDLAEAAGRDTRIGSVRARAEERLRELAAAVAPRAEYTLVHGELGPDHVLVDPGGRAVLIDIEGLMHFDAEWEHVFLRLRFGGHYAALARPDLDPRRLALYTLATHLSLVAGPLRLLDGGFPDRDVMRGIAEHNLHRVLALLP